MYNHPSYFLVAALAGFGVNTTAILVIKLTNSLTLRVSETCVCVREIHVAPQ